MNKLLKTSRLISLSLLLLIAVGHKVAAQGLVVNMASLEGLDITPENMWGFQVQSTASHDIRCAVEGRLVFRNSNHSIKYKFNYLIKPGINQIDPSSINPVWTFSSLGLRELFQDYKVLPQGTYQYCVGLEPNAAGSEYNGGTQEDCIYKQSKDLFSLNLMEPEDKAKIHEYNPMLSWVTTYPFASQLTYKIRIAEIKNGQNAANAITRNNPVYSEANLVPSSIVYPVYAKPLRTWQPYAWTVDAYYKGILLGGAQPWRFMIVEDSVLKSLPVESSYIDINLDENINRYPAVGNAKIKYTESDFIQNELKIKLVKKGVEVKKSEVVWQVQRGTNFHTFDLTDFDLSHNQEVEIVIEFKNSKSNSNKQEIKFKYVNPDFVK